MTGTNILKNEMFLAIDEAAQARANLDVWLRTSQQKDQEVFSAYDDEVRRTDREMRAAVSTYVMNLASDRTRRELDARRSA